MFAKHFCTNTLRVVNIVAVRNIYFAMKLMLVIVWTCMCWWRKYWNYRVFLAKKKKNIYDVRHNNISVNHIFIGTEVIYENMVYSTIDIKKIVYLLVLFGSLAANSRSSSLPRSRSRAPSSRSAELSTRPIRCRNVSFRVFDAAAVYCTKCVSNCGFSFR